MVLRHIACGGMWSFILNSYISGSLFHANILKCRYQYAGQVVGYRTVYYNITKF